MAHANDAKTAFRGEDAVQITERLTHPAIAYTKFHDTPIFLEWAPADVLDGVPEVEAPAAVAAAEDAEPPSGEGHVLFVKNVNFDTTDEKLK